MPLNFVQVTGITNEKVFIAIEKIEYIKGTKSHTKIGLSSGETLHVKETPEQILGTFQRNAYQ